MFMRIATSIVFSFSLVTTVAHADGLASGDAIKAAIGGNTVRGAMDASGGYEEFYSADGKIKGADYSGEWSVKGDRMCFVYDGNPPSCWAVRLNDKSITWVGSTGNEGSGVILSGNPAGY